MASLMWTSQLLARMRPVRAAALAALAATLLLAAVASAAGEDALSVSVSARPNAKVGDEYRAQVSIPNDGTTTVSAASVDVVSAPPLEDAEIVAPSGTTCSSTGDSAWTCELGDLAAGDRLVLTVKGRIAPGADAQVTSATLAAAEASDSTSVTPRADVSLTMASPELVELPTGDAATVVLLVTNSGPAAVDTTVVLLAPRDSWDLTSTSCAAADNHGATLRRVVCHIDALPAGETRSLDIAATTLAAGTGDVFAVAYPDGAVTGASRVYYSTVDSYLPNNGDSFGYTIADPVDKEETREGEGEGEGGTSNPDGAAGNGGNNGGSGSPGSSTSGTGEGGESSSDRPWHHTGPAFTTSLAGPATLTQGVEGAYTLTAYDTSIFGGGTLRVSLSIENGRFTGATDGCSSARKSVTCIFQLLPGDHHTATIMAVGLAPGDLVVTATPAEGKTGNGAVTTFVEAPATDLQFVTFSATPNDPKVGDTVTVTLSVKNAGTIGVGDSFVETTIPAGLDVPDTPYGPCVKTGDTIRCFLGKIAAGATKTISVDVKAETAGDFSGTGYVGSSVRDTDARNDARSLGMSVRPA